MNENEEAQMIFQDELPVIMDEAEALEAVSTQIEEIYYETQNRMQSKGKGFKSKERKARARVPHGHLARVHQVLALARAAATSSIDAFCKLAATVVDTTDHGQEPDPA